jgi:protein SCO1/2
MRPHRAHIAGLLGLSLGLSLTAATGAAAAGTDPLRAERPIDRMKDPLPPKPRELENVDVVEKLGKYVALDVPFRDEQGRPVTLRDYFDTGLPVLLTFNYSTCPMLCSLQLGALSGTLLEIPETDGIVKMAPNQQFHIVTIILHPKETPEGVQQTKQSYVERFDPALRPDIDGGWHFLLGSEDAIAQVAESVGYGYEYLPEQGEYAHPAAIMVLASDGQIIRYIKGIEYGPDALTESIFAAGINDPQESIGFVLSCFHYDSKRNSYARFGKKLMTYVGGAFALFLLAAISTWHLSRRSGRQPDRGV